jgi:hypothetical protein
MGYGLPVVYLFCGVHIRRKGEIETADSDIRTGRPGPPYVIRGIPVKIIEFCFYLPLAGVVAGALLLGTGLVDTGWAGSTDRTLAERFQYVDPGLGLVSCIPGVILYRLFKSMFGQYKSRFPETGRGRNVYRHEERPSTPPESKERPTWS